LNDRDCLIVLHQIANRKLNRPIKIHLRTRPNRQWTRRKFPPYITTPIPHPDLSSSRVQRIPSIRQRNLSPPFSPFLQYTRAAAERRFRSRRRFRRLLLASGGPFGAGGGEELRDRSPMYIFLPSVGCLGLGGVWKVEAAPSLRNKICRSFLYLVGLRSGSNDGLG